jgi:heme A synthase
MYDVAVTSKLGRFAWGVLGYNVAVILWGAYVRATGSGAGCGGHWPLCNGEVLPRVQNVATLIEFSHRITSGLALVAVVALAWWVWRARPAGDPARKAAGFSVLFILTEAAVGAGLVLFALVADNASFARALFMAVHLMNTFALVASLTLTAWWTTGGAPVRMRGKPFATMALLGTAFGLLLVGTSGAVAALGDTLYPARTLADALSADLSPTSHFLIRLRFLHPALALVVAFALIALVRPLRAGLTGRGRTAGTLVVALAVAQLAAGGLNVMLLAPVWMQMVHLLVADLLWIAFVAFGAGVAARAG